MLNFDHRPLQTMLSGSTLVGITFSVVSVSPSTIQRLNKSLYTQEWYKLWPQDRKT